MSIEAGRGGGGGRKGVPRRNIAISAKHVRATPTVGDDGRDGEEEKEKGREGGRERGAPPEGFIEGHWRDRE